MTKLESYKVEGVGEVTVHPDGTEFYLPSISTKDMMDQLKEWGFKTHIQHWRSGRFIQGLHELSMGEIRTTGQQHRIGHWGGRTIASISLDDFTDINAVSLCNPKDKYNRKEGANRALFRAYCIAKELIKQ